MGTAHDQDAAQDPHRLPALPPAHPHRETRDHAEIAREPDALKGAYPVQAGATGKGPTSQTGTSPVAYRHSSPSSLHCGAAARPGRRRRTRSRTGPAPPCGAAGPAAVVRAHGRSGGGAGPGQLLQLPVKRRHVALDGHHVIRVPAEDDLRRVALRVQSIDRDDCPGQVSEGFQQVPDSGDLVGLRGHGGLPEGRADAVRQGRDQVRSLSFLVLRAADGLPVDGDHQPAGGPHGPGPQPGAENLVEQVGADQGERAPEVDSSAGPRSAPSPASTSAPASAAHWPIAANDLDPAITAAIPTASSPASECRRPRLPRGPGPAQEDQEDNGSGQPIWAKMSSAGGVPRGRRW
jgi:hypothetical protein